MSAKQQNNKCVVSHFELFSQKCVSHELMEKNLGEQPVAFGQQQFHRKVEVDYTMETVECQQNIYWNKRLVRFDI